MTELATVDWFGRWGTSVFSENTAIFSFGVDRIIHFFCKWSSFHINCCFITLYLDCGPLTAPENGSVDQSEGTTYGRAVVYSCDPGHSLLGDGTRLCQTNGQWTSTPPICSPIGSFLNFHLLCCLYLGVSETYIFNTVMIRSFRTDRSGQTVQTQIRLLLKGLQCLQFRLYLLAALL